MKRARVGTEFRAVLRRLLAAGLLLVAAPPSSALAARGGPDAGNWSWADSTEPGVDTRVEGMITQTPIAPSIADEAIYPVTLSFPFTLYGTTSSTLWLSSNGWLSLLDPGAVTAPVATPIPTPGTPDAMLAFYWADLDGQGGAFGLHGPTASGHQILLRLREKASGDLVQLVIQFYFNGSLKIWYVLVPNAIDASLGIEDASGAIGSRVHYATAPATGFRLVSDLAVLYYPSSTLGCATAAPIACSGSTSGSTAAGSNGASVYGCGGPTYSGREAIYSFTTTSVQSLQVTLSGLGTRDLDVFLLRAGCDSRTDCLALGADTLDFPVLAPGTWWLVVDGKTPADDGPFTLTTSCGPASAPIACNGSVNGSITATSGSGIDTYGCTGSTPFGSGERIYDFTLTAATTVIASISPPVPFSLFLVDSATLTPINSPCLLSGYGTLGRLNLPPGNYSVLVDGPGGAGGSFRVDLSCLPGVPSVPIDCGQSNVPGNTGPNLIDSYDCLLPALYPEGEAFYSFRPTGWVNVVASVDFPPAYDIFGFREADVPATCFYGNDAGLSLINMPPGNYIFALDAESPPGATPSMSLTCTQLNYPPLLCDSSQPGVTASTSQIDVYPCFARVHDGGEAYFTFDNPVTQDLAFAISGVPAGVDLDLAVMTGGIPFPVSAIPCRIGGDVVVRLPAEPPGPFLLVVDAGSGAASVPFTISAACGSTALGCASVPEVTCNSRTPGDTGSGPDKALLYGDDGTVYSGPERAYHFFNPVLQDVSFALRGVSDPRLDLILLDACDTATLLSRGDDALIEPRLPAGDYWVVVDGREEIAGNYELLALCGAPALEPPTFSATLAPGSCTREQKTLYFPPFVPDSDLVFSLDLSDSMGTELAELKASLLGHATALAQRLPSLALGLASFTEYEQCYTDTVCGQNGCPSTASAYAFRVEEPVTANFAQVDATLQGLATIGGGKESYTRSFFESYTSPELGWRNCTRHLWVSVGDEAPVDCNVYACIGGVRNEGRDPGPDLSTGTADDLVLLPVLDAMVANETALLPLDSSESAQQQAMWECLAQRTGAHATFSDRFGVPLPANDLVRNLVHAAVSGTRDCPLLQLVPTGPDASWVSITPPVVSNARTPYWGQFEVTFCVPAGASAGSHSIPIEARCLGRSICAPELLASQSVTIEVPNACPVAPSAMPATPPAPCAGNPLTLDGSASIACDASGLEYRWSSGTTVLCDWRTAPTCTVTPSLPATTYTLEVRCAGSPSCTASAVVSVTPVPPPVAAAGPDQTVCLNDAALLDGSASSGPSCPGGLLYEWRSGTTVLRPASPVATFSPSTTVAATTNYTLVVSCAGLPGCATSDELSFTVRDCTVPVRFGAFSATLRADGLVEIKWRTLAESGTLGFRIERGERASGPFVDTGLSLEAQGPMSSYRLVDPLKIPGGSERWYRIVEITGSGPGDATPPFPAGLTAPGDSRSRSGVERGRSRARP